MFHHVSLYVVAISNTAGAFLRSLETFRNEYHGGIIFLTTNRILKIDLAVRSRVHIPIYYSPLGKQARKDIYSRCVTKLQKHGFKMPESTSFLQVMEEMKWNGREISNCKIVLVSETFLLCSNLTIYSAANDSCIGRI